MDLPTLTHPVAYDSISVFPCLFLREHLQGYAQCTSKQGALVGNRSRSRPHLALQRGLRMACPSSFSRKALQGECLFACCNMGTFLQIASSSFAVSCQFLAHVVLHQPSQPLWYFCHPASLEAVSCRLWKGIVPLWGRQIPYTMMKFGKIGGDVLRFMLQRAFVKITGSTVPASSSSH